MAASSRRSCGPILRSHSPSGRFTSSYSSQFTSSSSSAFAYSSSGLSSRSSTSFSQHRSISPPRVDLCNNLLHRRPCGSHSITVRPLRTVRLPPLHKSFNNSHSVSGCAPSNRLNARRSAMTNSLVRIGGVEGDIVRRALSALIRPSSHQQRRRSAFQPRPSRLFSGDLRTRFGAAAMTQIPAKRLEISTKDSIILRMTETEFTYSGDERDNLTGFKS
ncbi:Serine-rich protein-related [Hibiscus syriacus]|uniref:Serine-rich protein-related n=1 Tax=Hibiscus syriacus TaxID=106335 RepID=A0A6A2WAF3_HIBSY|nr:Serine-rich protein-related [Hibiscus syriacus]